MLKVIKTQGFTHYLEDTFFEKPHGGVKLTSSVILGLSSFRNGVCFEKFRIKSVSCDYIMLRKLINSSLAVGEVAFDIWEP